MGRPSERMSSCAMELLQSPVGFCHQAVTIFRELLADDNVEREVLKFADAGHAPTAPRKLIATRKTPVHGRPATDRTRAVALCGGNGQACERERGEQLGRVHV